MRWSAWNRSSEGPPKQREKETNDRRESYILRDIIILTINSESVDDKDEYISEDNQIWN